jgi:predicted MFS family arabinose efflux permease
MLVTRVGVRTAVDDHDRLRRNRDFHLLLTGSSVSMLGSRLTAIGLPLLVLAITGSPLAAGWAGFAGAAPSVLILLPAGALVDRWNPRPAMIVSEVGRGAAITVVVVLVWLHHPSVELLIGLVVVAEVLGVFSALSERRLICSLVEPDNTASALASAEARTHLVVLAGRSLGAFLFGLGRALPFLADALSFVVSTGVIMRIKRWRSRQPEQDADRNLRREMAEGLRWVRSDHFARIAFPLTACTTLIGQALIMVFLAEAHEARLPPDRIGLVLAASGAGGVLGSAAAYWFFQRFKYALLSVQMQIWTIMFAILAWFGGKAFFLMAVVLTVTGFAGALGNIALDTYTLRRVNERMLARATSIDRLTTFGGLALGPLLGGAMVERCGVHVSICVLFVAVVGLTVAATAAQIRSRTEPSEYLPRDTPAPTHASSDSSFSS